MKSCSIVKSETMNGIDGDSCEIKSSTPNGVVTPIR